MNDDERVYATGSLNNVTIVDATLGSVLWSLQLPSNCLSECKCWQIVFVAVGKVGYTLGGGGVLVVKCVYQFPFVHVPYCLPD